MSWYTERGQMKSKSENRGGGFTVAGMYNTDQCIQGCSVWVLGCINRLPADLCGSCNVWVLCCIPLSLRARACACVHTCIICANLQLRDISWALTSAVPASRPDSVHMTLCTRDRVKGKMERRGDGNRGHDGRDEENGLWLSVGLQGRGGSGISQWWE